MAAPSSDSRFRKVLRDRVLEDMLKQGRAKGAFVVLVRDGFTRKVLGSLCKDEEIEDREVIISELGENKKQAIQEALYFIEPDLESLALFRHDLQGEKYKSAKVFFSSPLPVEYRNVLREDPKAKPRIKRMFEFNLEVVAQGSHAFVTDTPGALGALFSRTIHVHDFEHTINQVAGRLATVFASLKEFPAINYQAPRSLTSSASTMSTQGASDACAQARAHVPMAVAAALSRHISEYRTKFEDYPAKASCDLLILDRSMDIVSPVIHSWSYGGACFDILPMEEGQYKFKYIDAAGVPKYKLAALDEDDPLFEEVQDLFMSAAMAKVQEKSDAVIKEFQANDLSNPSVADLQRLKLEAEKLTDRKYLAGLHLEVCKDLMQRQKKEHLDEVGELEQGLVFGDREASKERLEWMLDEYEHEVAPMTKLRLLLLYATTHPDRADPKLLEDLCQKADLGREDLQALLNLECLGVPLGKPPRSNSQGGSIFPHFGLGQAASAASASRQGSGCSSFRQERGDHKPFVLDRFYPALQDVVEDFVSGKYAAQDFPPMSCPLPASPVPAPPPAPAAKGAVGSVRGGGTGAGSSAGAGAGAATPWYRSKKPWLFVFVVGGITRSEVTVVRHLSKKLNREIILGSTSIDTPFEFVERLKELHKPRAA